MRGGRAAAIGSANMASRLLKTGLRDLWPCAAGAARVRTALKACAGGRHGFEIAWTSRSSVIDDWIVEPVTNRVKKWLFDGDTETVTPMVWLV